MLGPLSSFFKIKKLQVLYYKGHLTLPQAGVIRSEAELFKFLQKETITAEGLAGLLSAATGMFALAVAVNGKVYMACDIIRSIPLFVVRTGNETFLATHIDPEGPLKGSLQTNPDKLVELLSSGYVYGSATVYDNLYSLQAGELLTLCEEGESSFRFELYLS